MSRSIRSLGFTLIVLLFFASCKSGKMIMSNEGGVRLAGEEHLMAVIANTPVFDSFSARLRMTVPLKKSSYTLNGTLKMQHDRLIQISLLLPVIRTEVARIEISPEQVLVIDRMNKRYASVPVSELRDYFHTEIDFPMLQSLFSNRLFLPGKYELTRRDFSSFKVREKGEDAVELSRKSREFVFSFLASFQTNRLMESTIETHSSKYILQWKYNNFVPVGETSFPSEMAVLMGKKESPTQTLMELSRLTTDKQTLVPTRIPDRYEQMKMNDLINMLQKL